MIHRTLVWGINRVPSPIQTYVSAWVCVNVGIQEMVTDVLSFIVLRIAIRLYYNGLQYGYNGGCQDCVIEPVTLWKPLFVLLYLLVVLK